jgi:hypothetical protein
MNTSFRFRFKFFTTALFGLLFTAFIIGPLAPVACADESLFGDYLNSPVFFEMFWEEYNDTTNFDLLPDGKIYLYPLGLRDLSNFSWVDSMVTKGNRDYSWFLRLGNMRYLVPFIKSSDPQHRSFLREWFEDWYKNHKNLHSPNKAAWDLMTTAVRSMVLTYYLKQLTLESSLDAPKERSDEDQLLITHLLETLLDHQQHLAVPENFDERSNHGMWEAIGLFESTRIFPGEEIMELALARLMLIVDKSVSKQGLHMEHSTAYHYYFLDWLEKYVIYLKSLENFSWDDLQGLERRLQAMKDAAYFLQDHDGNMPAIGDTDKGRVPDRFLLETTTDEDGLCFDKNAGYAIYKDHTEFDLRRYLIFNIQNQNPDLPYHYHNDALAVYYNCMGEVILGDQGRFEYGHSPERTYFQSCFAHNTAVPARKIKKTNSDFGDSFYKRHRYVKKPVWEDKGNTISLSAEISNRLAGINRRVLIPKNEPNFMVEDFVTGSVPIAILWNIGYDVESIDRIEHSAKINGVDDYFEWILVTANKKRYSMSISVNGQQNNEGASVDIYKGCEDPMLGWYAPSYLVKVPTTLIIVQVTPSHRNSFTVVTRLAEIE